MKISYSKWHECTSCLDFHDLDNKDTEKGEKCNKRISIYFNKLANECSKCKHLEPSMN